MFPGFDSLHSLLLPPPHLGKSWKHSSQVPLWLPLSGGSTAFHGPVKGKVLPFSRSSGAIKAGERNVTKLSPSPYKTKLNYSNIIERQAK